MAELVSKGEVAWLHKKDAAPQRAPPKPRQDSPPLADLDDLPGELGELSCLALREILSHLGSAAALCCWRDLIGLTAWQFVSAVLAHPENLHELSPSAAQPAERQGKAGRLPTLAARPMNFDLNPNVIASGRTQLVHAVSVQAFSSCSNCES